MHRQHAYAPAFRTQMVELVRNGRTPSTQSWVTSSAEDFLARTLGK